MDDDFNLTDEDLELWYYVSQQAEAMHETEHVKDHESVLDESVKQEKISIEDLEKLVAKPKQQTKNTKHNYIKHGTSAGVDKATAKRITGGKFKIERTIDLHGKNQDQALEDLRHFIKGSFDMDKRKLLVITGKGADNDGVLKKQVPRWLNTQGVREYVLMFSYAQTKHGGDGALYVLLKRRH